MPRRWLLCVLWFALFPVVAHCADEVKIQPDVVYGHKDGMALTFDVLTPPKANGAAVLWIQSGGWYSGWVDPKNFLVAGKPYLDKGFTLIIVRHGSAPKFAVPDAVADVRRCVRFIRMQAKELGVDPERLGVTGGSAGGHLTLMLATTGDEGDPSAQDVVLRQSSRIRAAVALYPPTDISTWVDDPPEEIKKIPALKPPLTFDAKLAPQLSPLLHASKSTAPTLMIHGDKDLLVPIEHSQNMQAALEREGATSELLTIEGAAHGFSQEQNQKVVIPAMVGWFEKHLAAGIP